MEGNEEKSKCDGDSSDGDCKGTPTQPRCNSVQREREAKKTLSDEKLVSRGDEEGSIFALEGNVTKLMNGLLRPAGCHLEKAHEVSSS